MASTLISNTNSRQQYQANLLSKRPNHVKVIVEDENDVVLWHKILKLWQPDKVFEITPYFHDASIADSKGKGHILRLAPQFGPYLIGCVDSDYDYLLENYTTDGSIIKNSPYILQTFGYSIENLVCQPYGVSDMLIECKKHSCEIQRNADADFTAFINDISKAVYPTLLWHLILKKENRPIKDWNEIFGNDHYKAIIQDKSLGLEQKRSQVLSLFHTLSTQAETNYAAAFPDLETAKTALEIELNTNYGLNPDNAFLFVRGHDLFEFLHFTFFEPLDQQIYNEHIIDIKSKLQPQEWEIATKHYQKISRKPRLIHLTSCVFLEDNTNYITTLIANSTAALPI